MEICVNKFEGLAAALSSIWIQLVTDNLFKNNIDFF